MTMHAYAAHVDKLSRKSVVASLAGICELCEELGLVYAPIWRRLGIS